MKVVNQNSLKSKRRSLRKNQTPHEGFLWSKLRNRKLGYKFYRQFSVGSYILDFYCQEKKLAIELDGSQHLYNEGKDKKRTEYLKKQGIKVLRFWNYQVRYDIDKVLERILRELE